MPDRSYRVLLWSLALTGVLLDQATKYGVFAWLHGVESNTFAVFQTEPEQRFFQAVPPSDPAQRDRQRGFFLAVAFLPGQDASGKPVPHVNHGALFGFLSDYKAGANGMFALISLLAAGAILFWASQKSTARDRWLCTALGLILAGTLGNFYDRLMYNGVRDFLHWHYGFNWPVFNFADCCLVGGACLLLVQAFFVPHPASQPAGQAEQQALSTGAVSGIACSAGTTTNG
jgi:lipoprotein signal peptidase